MLALAALAYNILHYIGQHTLIGPDAPIRKAVHRRRLRTVLQEMIYKATRLVRHGQRYVCASAAAILATRRWRAATHSSLASNLETRRQP